MAAPAATSDERFGSIEHSSRQTFCARLSPHRTQQTGVLQGRPPPRLRPPLHWRVRRQSKARSIPPRSQRTLGFSRSDRTPPRPVAGAELLVPVYRVPSTRSPKRSAWRLRIRAPTALPRAIATATSLPCPRESRAIPAATRTTARKILRPPTTTPQSWAIGSQTRTTLRVQVGHSP